jgi:hypothetical protein
MISADFNHDGVLDLAIASFNSEYPSYKGAVTILLGNGDGTFKKPGFREYEAFGVEYLASGDFNNDGNLDVIDVNMDLNHGPEGIGIFLGNGDGSLGQHIHHEADFALDHVAVGDFDGDGNLDAVVSSYTSPGFLALYRGKGDGSLVGPYPVAHSRGLPATISAGDFNLDGVSDIVLVSDTVQILLGDGTGNFYSGGAYQTVPTQVVVQGDFNEDGVIDLAFAGNTHPAGVDVLLGRGDGTFQAAIHSMSPPYVFSHLASADFNGDGHLDLITIHDLDRHREWAIHLGNGDGTFQAPIEHLDVTDLVLALVAADFNHDGLADLALGDLNGNVSIFPNLGDCP